MTNDAPASLFAQVCAASGLAPLLAEKTLARACQRAGIVVPSAIDRAGLTRALPAIQASIEIYLPPPAVEAAMRRLRALALGRAD